MPDEPRNAASLTLTGGSDASIVGDYRYKLSRWWGDGARLVWVMLNPSTADAHTDDPTIRRVRSFTEREGYAGFDVVNLYSLRATDPEALTGHPDPVGPGGDVSLWHAIRRAAAVVAAWGAHPMAVERADLVRRFRPDALCLGRTKSGAPRHPLYVKGDAPLVPLWTAESAPFRQEGDGA